MHPRTTALLLAFAVVTTALAPKAEAFDGQRKGFVLGAGAGYGWLWDPTYDGHEEGHGLATHLDIGVALDDRWILHYAGKQLLNMSDYTHLVPAVGATYYLEDDAPGPFVTGGGGIGLFTGFGYDDLTAGFTVFGGVGYEFVRHWNVEVDYVNMFDVSGGPPVSTHTLLLTVGVLAY
jgi:hypothetical protein